MSLNLEKQLLFVSLGRRGTRLRSVADSTTVWLVSSHYSKSKPSSLSRDEVKAHWGLPTQGQQGYPHGLCTIDFNDIFSTGKKL